MKTNFVRKIFAIAIAIFSLSQAYGQSLKWAQTWNSSGTQKDLGSAVTVDGSGNVYVTGGANYPQMSDRSVEIIKYNSSGTQQWAYNVNVVGTSGTCDFEYGYSIAVDASGYVWVAACTYSGAINYDDLTLIRLDNNGNLQSNYPKRYSIATDNCNGGAVELGTALYVYNASNVYIGGSNYNNSTSTWSFIVLKDDVGNAGWSWTYTKSGTQAGTGYEHRVTDIKADANYVYATGWIQNTNQGKDVWTVKLDASNGSSTCTNCWTAQYDNSADALDQVSNALVIDGSNNVYVAGYQGTSTNGTNALLLKYNASGVIQTGFPATYNGSGNSNDAWTDIALGPGGTAIAVYTGGYAYRTTTNYDYALAAYTSGGALASGWSTNPVFYDGAGTTEATGSDKGYAIEYSSNSSVVYITGKATENSPNTNDPNITSKGYNATNGSNVWSASYDYGSLDIANTDEMAWKYGLQVKYNSSYCVDEIYIEGDRYASSTGYDFLTLKYGPCPSCSPCLRPGGRYADSDLGNFNLKIYPNPFFESAALDLPFEAVSATLIIRDITGRAVEVIPNIGSNHLIIERENMPPGVYFFSVIRDGSILGIGKFAIID